jgi:hypothetical protein
MRPRHLLLLPEREAEIARLAEALAQEHFPLGRAEPEQLAHTESITFSYASFVDEFDGVLVPEAGRFYLICNDRLHPRGSPRSRFTFAHELGHYFIASHRAALASGTWPTHYSRSEHSSDSFLEIEADLFAAHLLMPERWFLERFATASGDLLTRLAAQADYFGTSFTASAYRALKLELLPSPAALFRWDACGQLRARKLSEATGRLDDTFRGLVDTPPVGSVTARSIDVLSSIPVVGTSHAMDWFPRLTGYGVHDQQSVCEHVQPLGQHGWLTLLHRASAE